MAWDDYKRYPPEVKEQATMLFNDGLNVNDVVAVLRETYPRLTRATLNSWSITDEVFGAVYRNGIASKAQSVVVESMEQLEDVYAKVTDLLYVDDSKPIEEQLRDIKSSETHAIILRLMMDTARHKKTTALALLGRINKNYSDKTSNAVAFENAPTIQLEVVDNGVQNP